MRLSTVQVLSCSACRVVQWSRACSVLEWSRASPGLAIIPGDKRSAHTAATPLYSALCSLHPLHRTTARWPREDTPPGGRLELHAAIRTPVVQVQGGQSGQAKIFRYH